MRNANDPECGIEARQLTHVRRLSSHRQAMDEIAGHGGYLHVFREHLSIISHCSSNKDLHL
jgi:hypothetical protein